MNLAVLNPKNWFPGRGGFKALPGSNLTARESAAQGPWTAIYNTYEPRVVNPRLYEAIRESIGVVDAAINKLVTFDGILRIEGRKQKLVQEIQAWADTVPVGPISPDGSPLGVGLQSFYAQQGNEMYEQGFSIGQWVPSANGRDVIGLKVADSKGVFFMRTDAGMQTWYRRPRPIPQRTDGLQQIENILRNNLLQDLTGFLQHNDYRLVDPSRLVYCAYNIENSIPYGISMIRSLEFVSRVLLTMHNALGQSWGRFGDPSFHVQYKTANKQLQGAQLEERRLKIATDFANTLNMKRQGNSADFVTAVSGADDVAVSVIGSGNQELQIKEPSQHIVENIISKTNMPAWLLGFHFSTTERLAQKQCDILLQDARTRWIQRKPGLVRAVEAMLRARGRTWSPGDWDIVQELPNISDVIANAQANFYNAQADLMSSNAGDISATPAKPPKKTVRRTGGQKSLHSHKESFVESDPKLPKLEAAAEKALVAQWLLLQSQTLTALHLPMGKGMKAPDNSSQTYLFNPGDASLFDTLQSAFVVAAGGSDSALVSGMVNAWLRGVANGASELNDPNQVELLITERNKQQLAQRGLQLVTDAAIRDYQGDILAALVNGEYDGMKPDDVAAALKSRFQAHEYNWRRMARTEISNAQFNGKLAQYQAHGINQYEWITAPDACSICVALADGGPYTVGAGPTPETDSHPECRCSTEAVVG